MALEVGGSQVRVTITEAVNGQLQFNVSQHGAIMNGLTGSGKGYDAGSELVTSWTGGETLTKTFTYVFPEGLIIGLVGGNANESPTNAIDMVYAG